MKLDPKQDFALLSDDELLAQTDKGSTPISRTVELRVALPVAACRVSVAGADCEIARCSQRYQPGPPLGSGSASDSPAHV